MSCWRPVLLTIALLANASDFVQGQDSRPRRVKSASDRCPLIRVGLLTDVSSVTLESPSPITLEPQSTDGRTTDYSDNRRAKPVVVEEGTVRVEVSRAKRKTYRVEAIATNESRRARKVADEVKRETAVLVSTEYDDEEDRYIVLVGEFETEREAEKLRERLRHKGQRSARVVSRTRSSPQLRLVAYEAGKEVASTEGSLVAKAADVAAERRGSSVKTQEVAARRTPNPSVARFDPGAASGPVRVGGKPYRGEIHLVLSPRGRLNVVNVVSVEDYLRGVVPLEISPSSFPQIEALKAQAVAARSYALARRSASAYHAQGFDLRDDARSQVYGGLSAEHPLTSRAVEETSGVVCSHDGAIIEALYTSTCGGRTENNEAVFSGRPVSYLRSVACAADEFALRKREIRSARDFDPDARSTAREYAMLDVLGFSLPRRPAALYLKSPASRDELLRWADRAAEIMGNGAGRKAPTPLDVARLPGFAMLVSWAVYGDSRPSKLLSPADVDYLLADIGSEQLPRESRSDVAQLLNEGVLRLPSETKSLELFAVTRGFAIETFARALSGQLKADESPFRAATAEPAEGGRLLIAARARGGRKEDEPERFDVDVTAWLFRRLGGQSYAVKRLVIIGGEPVVFHLDRNGKVDFLEIEPAPRGASSDRASSASYWQVRLTRAEAQQRLARSRFNIGELEDLVPVASGQSNRVTELEAIGGRGKARLSGSVVRTALGLKESLFVISRERTSGTNRVAAFVFKGRGWGHGVGMCQVGAYGLAKEGYTYQAILKKYYSGIKIERIY